jgi:hypothetical protein
MSETNLLENTLFVAVKHPAARGLGNEYFHGVGKWISAMMDNAS